MPRAIWQFLRKEDLGQDISEYCLLTALVVLIALGIFWHVSGGIQGVWTSANTTIATSGTSTNSSTSAGYDQAGDGSRDHRN